MSAPEASVQSFVVRIWLEESQAGRGQAFWRGHITDVTSAQRSYVQDLDGIIAFLLPRLQQMGISIGLRWRMQVWLWQRRTKQRRET